MIISFFATSFSFITHKPESVTAVLSSTRPIMNSSIVPMLLSTEETWKLMCKNPFTKIKEENFLKLFSTFCDTMQFAKRLTFSSSRNQDPSEISFINGVLEGLIENKRYFTRTLQHLKFPNDSSVPIVCGKLLNLTSIDVGFCRGFNDSTLKLVCKHLPNLESLKLNYKITITNESLDLLPQSLKYLQHLDLSYTSVTNLAFMKELKSLKSVTLDFANKLSEPDAFRITTTTSNNNNNDDEDSNNKSSLVLFPSLVEYRFCTRYPNGIDLMLQQLQRHAPNLTSLTATRMTTGGKGYEAITKMSNLKKLHLFSSSLLKEENFFGGLSMMNLSCLEDISLLDCEEIDDSGLEHLSKSPSPIRSLTLHLGNKCEFGNSGFRHLITNLKYLEKLCIHNNVKAGPAEFTGDIGEEKCCSSSSAITYLTDLSFSNVGSLSDDGLKSILMKPSLISLGKLTVQRCGSITGEGLRRAFENSNTKNTLEHLDINNSVGIKDLSFLECLSSLKSLVMVSTDLDFETMREKKIGFSKLPDSLEDIALAYTSIEDIDLVQEFPSCLSCLKKLNLSCCYKLTNRGLIEGVSRFSSTLERLDIADWHKDAFTVEEIISTFGGGKKFPRLDHIEFPRVLLRGVEHAKIVNFGL